MQRSSSSNPPPGTNNDKTMRTVIDKPLLLALIRDAHILAVQMVWLGAQAPVAEGVERQAVEVLGEDEEHHQHAALAVDGAFDCERQAGVGGVDVRVCVGDVEGGGDEVAEAEVATRKVGDFADLRAGWFGVRGGVGGAGLAGGAVAPGRCHG